MRFRQLSGPTDLLPKVRLSFESHLTESSEALWAWATSTEGISRELRPILRMTVPRGVRTLTDLPFRPGETLFRSWILLFGVLPVDRSDLTILEIDPGRSFVEQSPMWSMRLWRHQRTVIPIAGGCRIRDDLTFAPRGARRAITWLVRVLFTHRHAVLRRRWGARSLRGETRGPE